MAKQEKFRRLSTKNLRYSRGLTFAYHTINRKYFEGRLPNLEVYYEPMRLQKNRGGMCTTSGYTAIAKGGRILFIAINDKLRKFEDLAELVLLHECIHVKYPLDPDDHGPRFQKERRRLIVAGAIDEIL